MKTTLNRRRIGAYGGTFDPIHNGHIEIVRAVVSNFGLDRLLIIPAKRPPHKDSREISNSYHRYAMAALASMDEPRVVVSTVEIDAPERPYSYQTVERLGGEFGPGVELYFVIGADSFEEIGTWREPARLLAAANVVVVTRPGHEMRSAGLPRGAASSIIDMRAGAAPGEASGAGAGARRVYLTDYVNLDVSSTEVRRMARDGEPIGHLVPPRVGDYVRKYDLYRR